MKINEIIINEGFLDKLKQVGGAAMTGVKTAVRSSQLGNIADLSSKSWIKQLGAAEARNNYQPLDNAQLQKFLRQWIDQTLMGSMSLKSADQEVQQTVNQAVTKIMAQPRNRNQAADEFEKILQLSIASGKQDVGGSRPQTAQQTVDGMKGIANYNASTGQLTAKPGKEAELAQALKSMGLA